MNLFSSQDTFLLENLVLCFYFQEVSEQEVATKAAKKAHQWEKTGENSKGLKIGLWS